MNVRGFASLARSHRWRLDQLRRKVAELDAMRVGLVEQDMALERQLAAERQTAGAMTLVDFAAYSRRIGERRDSLAKSIAELVRALAQASEQGAEEYRQAKKYEIALDREAERRRREQQRREQADLDEIGLTYHNA